jgi:SAM-dependent methyltransferase
MEGTVGRMMKDNRMKHANSRLSDALWRIYHRPDSPLAWTGGGNLPWNEPAFARRMLREHLDESHHAASRTTSERRVQIEWLWARLELQPGMRLLDLTCGPGLYAVEFAHRGCAVTGIDFSPAAIAYARELAVREGVADSCGFLEQDVHTADFGVRQYDAVLFLYGQLAVFPKPEAQQLLAKSAQALKPGGRLVVELLDQERVDKKPGAWWFTDDTGLWGDAPFLHLGERFWDAGQELSMERFFTIDLATGRLDEILLCDQTYAVPAMQAMMRQAGFCTVQSYEAWDHTPLYDAEEWIVYVAQV